MDKRTQMKRVHEKVQESDLVQLAIVIKDYSRIAFDNVVRFKQGLEEGIIYAHVYDELNDCINILNRAGERLDHLVKGNENKNAS